MLTTWMTLTPVLDFASLNKPSSEMTYPQAY